MAGKPFSNSVVIALKYLRIWYYKLIEVQVSYFLLKNIIV